MWPYWICLVSSLSLLFKPLSTTLVQDLDNGPFTCSGKVIGGYYADIQENCQMFHVCTIGENGETRDIVFRCLNGTVFDQETRVCEREEEVDCTQSVSFYYLNNELYGPGIIPDTAGGRINDGPMTVTRKDTQTPDSCQELDHSTLISVPELGCKNFHMCIQSLDQKMTKRTFECVQDGYEFDINTGKCSKINSKCKASQVSLRNTEVVDPMRICSLMGIGSYVVDAVSNCEQYFECPHLPQTPIATRRCPDGYLFSQTEGACVNGAHLNCETSKNEIFRHLSLLDSVVSRNQLKKLNILEHFKRSNHKLNSLSRQKRALSFENINRHREASHGTLTNVAGIFSDHASVIDVQGSGNVLDGKFQVPDFPVNFDDKGKEHRKNPSILSSGPVFESTVNKTSFNGATFEVSEIAPPDQSGKVTITSIVPKFVKQNGNGNNNNEQAETIAEVEPVALDNNPESSEIPIIDEHVSEIDEESYLISTTPIFDEVTEQLFEVEETTIIQEDETTVVEEITTDTTTASTTTRTSTTSTTSTTTSPVVESTEATKSTAKTPTPRGTPSDEEVSTNFTCKDKELEQFYPDIENNCRLFHYCSPGFSADEVLDLTFICSGETRFDIVSKKCEDIATVVCGVPETTTPIATTTVVTTTTTEEPTTIMETSTTSTLEPKEEQPLRDDINSTKTSLQHSLVTEINKESTTDFLHDNEITSEPFSPTETVAEVATTVQLPEGNQINDTFAFDQSTALANDEHGIRNSEGQPITHASLTRMSSEATTLSVPPEPTQTPEEVNLTTINSVDTDESLVSVTDEVVTLVEDFSTTSESVTPTSSILSTNIGNTPP